MGKNIIVSEETLRDLLEAHASLSAWYYELWAGLRAANATAHTPDDAARAAFVERLAGDFPEIAAVARSIQVPRMYVPAPPPYMMKHAAPKPREEPTTVLEPAQARARATPPGDPPRVVPEAPAAEAPAAEAPAAEAKAVAPPPLVNPTAVKYEP